MNALVAALIASSTFCSEPVLDFRSFYARFYSPGTSAHWQGYYYETFQSVFVRQSDASADFLEYRVARMERCR